MSNTTLKITSIEALGGFQCPDPNGNTFGDRHSKHRLVEDEYEPVREVDIIFYLSGNVMIKDVNVKAFKRAGECEYTQEELPIRDFGVPPSPYNAYEGKIDYSNLEDQSRVYFEVRTQSGEKIADNNGPGDAVFIVVDRCTP